MWKVVARRRMFPINIANVPIMMPIVFAFIVEYLVATISENNARNDFQPLQSFIMSAMSVPVSVFIINVFSIWKKVVPNIERSFEVK